MSLKNIEELNSAVARANAGRLSNEDFQVLVLKSLISLKESHVSLRSRLFDLEEDINNQAESTSITRTEVELEDELTQHSSLSSRDGAVVVRDEKTGLQFIEEDVPEGTGKERLDSETITSHSMRADIQITKAMMKNAKKHFDYNAVLVFEKLYHDLLPEEETSIAFNKAVALLNRLGFKHYGEGKYPLPHYLRDIIGEQKLVSFPNFLQAISFSMNDPIPLGLKNGFEKMDADKDGELDLEEVYKMLQTVSKSNYSKEDCMQFLLKADKDASGALSYVETLRLFYFTE